LYFFGPPTEASSLAISYIPRGLTWWFGLHHKAEFQAEKVLQSVMQALFHEAVKHMVRAFEARAQDIYGPAAPSAA